MVGPKGLGKAEGLFLGVSGKLRLTLQAWRVGSGPLSLGRAVRGGCSWRLVKMQLEPLV